MLATDARGNRSRTLPFVAVSWAVATVKFAISGMTLGAIGTMPVISASEYGAAVVTILGIWVAREWKQKSVEASDGNH